MELVITCDEKDLKRVSEGKFELVRPLSDRTVHKFFSMLSAYTFMRLEEWGFYEKKDIT